MKRILATTFFVVLLPILAVAEPQPRFHIDVPWYFLLSGGMQQQNFGSAVLGANNTFTGNNTLTAGQNSINFFAHNNIYWVGTNAANYPFTNPQTSIANCLTLAQLGCRTDLVSGNSFTTTSQTDIGSATRTVSLTGYPDVKWICNDTAAGTDACWNLHNGSTIFGQQNGTIGVSRTGGFYLNYACTAKTAYGINTPEGQAGNGQGYSMVKNITLEGCPTGTVAGGGSPSVAMVNIEAISEVNQWDNSLIFNGANTILTRIAANNNSAANQVGPIALNNWWNECNANTGCRPQVITQTGGGAVLPIYDLAGSCLHPGSGLACYTVDGNASAITISGGRISKYFEQLAAANNSIMLKFVDASNFVSDAIAMVVQNGDTGVDFSQTGAGRTCSQTVSSLRMNNTSVNAINNHISGFTATGKTYYPFYHFGGDGTCAFAPFTIDSNSVQIVNTTGVAHLIKNNANSEVDSVIDSGLNATQASFWKVYDQGTPIWGFGKNASNTAGIYDIGNNHYHFSAVRGGATALNSFGATAVTINASNSTGSGGLSVWNGAATSIEGIDLTGKGGIVAKGATPTVTGTGTCATSDTPVGGMSAGSIRCTGVSGAATITFTFGDTAPNFWKCDAYDAVTFGDTLVHGTHTNNSCTFSAAALVLNDLIIFSAVEY